MRTGLIGPGNVGGKLSDSLLRNGHDLTVHALNREVCDGFAARGAITGESPARMIRDCGVVITCLPSLAVRRGHRSGHHGTGLSGGHGR